MTVGACLPTLAVWASKIRLDKHWFTRKHKGLIRVKFSWNQVQRKKNIKVVKWVKNHHYQTTLWVISHETINSVRMCTLNPNFCFIFRILIQFVSFKDAHVSLLAVFFSFFQQTWSICLTATPPIMQCANAKLATNARLSPVCSACQYLPPPSPPRWHLQRWLAQVRPYLCPDLSWESAIAFERKKNKVGKHKK